MNAFTCKVCGKTSYSSADIEHQKIPNCPYCGANMREAIVISAATTIIRACEKMNVSRPVKIVLRDLFETDEDKCVICGEYVPEGRMVCPTCEKDPYRILRKKGGAL